MKKTSFLGVPIYVVDDEDITEAEREGRHLTYGMLRVADALPGVGSPALLARRVRVRCDDCGQPCWLDPDSFAPVARLHPARVCLQCLVARRDGAGR